MRQLALDEGRFLKAVRRILDWAGLTDRITLHSLRRYSLNRLAKFNLLAAQRITGHKETKTTILYTQLDPEHVLEVHTNVGVARGVLIHDVRVSLMSYRSSWTILVAFVYWT